MSPCDSMMSGDGKDLIEALIYISLYTVCLSICGSPDMEVQMWRFFHHSSAAEPINV